MANDNTVMMAQVQALAERVEHLEAQNAQLRSSADAVRPGDGSNQTAAAPAPAPAPAETIAEALTPAAAGNGLPAAL